MQRLSHVAASRLQRGARRLTATAKVLAAVGDAGLEQPTQPLVGIADTGLDNTRHGHVHDMRRSMGEALPLAAPRPIGEPHRPLGRVGRVPQSGRTTQQPPLGLQAVVPAELAFTTQQRHGQRALLLEGCYRQRALGCAKSDHDVEGRVIAVQPDHVGNQRHDALPAVIGQLVVDLAGEPRKQCVGAARVVRPPFSCQERRELHEARALAGAAMLAAGEDG